MNTTEKIGVKLLILREKHNLTQTEVGEKVGCTKATIYKYEKGLIDISVSTLRSILDIYGINVGKFLDEI